MLNSNGQSVIEVLNLAVSIAGRPVLRAIDLDVHAGEFVTLMGGNGSGKSTLVRAITGLLPHAQGSVRLFGTALEDFTDHQRVGFVPQRSGASGGVPASVREMVASGRLTRRRVLRPAGRADRRAIGDALDVVGLAHRAHESVSTLSGGQQQRVLIARALAGDPDLLVLDEPTAGVDLPHQQALARALGILSGRGATVLLVAHEIGAMASLIDRAVVMRDGRIAYDGPPLSQESVHDHHHLREAHHDHAPHVASPLDRLEGGR